MIVQDLIAALSACDPTLRVIMPGEEADFCEVNGVFRDLVQIRGLNVQLADERESDRLEVVRLFGPDAEGTVE